MIEMGASVGVRAATLGDSAGIRELAIELGMGATSQRAYNIWCRDFSRWSAVATDHTGQIVGFLIAYPRPARPEHLFIWQLGVRIDIGDVPIAAELVEHVCGDGIARIEYIPGTLQDSAARAIVDLVIDVREATKITAIGGAGGNLLEIVTVGVAADRRPPL